MAEFNQAIGVILEHEGGLVDHPNDPGGITNFGVSLRFMRSSLGQDNNNDGHLDGDFDHDGDIDADDVKKMSVTQAIDIYKRYWWDKFHYGLIDDQRIATKVFDMSVNMGAQRAHKITQTAINSVVGYNKLQVDGILGVKSISVINDLDNKELLKALCREQLGFYQRLVKSNAKFSSFIKGWTRRAIWPFKVLKDLS